MHDQGQDHSPSLPPEIARYYATAEEQQRLAQGSGLLELARSQDLLSRHLPPPPAVICDVGGGPGAYALWLARLGYEVHLVDPVPLHIEQARRASEQQPQSPIAGATVGDALNIPRADAGCDAVLLMGPLYHLVRREERVGALREARRVLRPGSVAVAVVISRWASALDGLLSGYLDDPAFVEIVERDLTDGQHRNPANHPGYFTTAFLHHPDELVSEVEEAGLQLEALLAIEGPGWLLPDLDERWRDDDRREVLMRLLRRLEHEPSLLGVSAHIMAIACRAS